MFTSCRTFSQEVFLRFKKPSPCYEVRSYEVSGNTLVIRLRPKGDVLCPQVITEGEVSLSREEASSVRRVKVFVEDRLWWEGFRRDR
jgi:hypothetical protein